MEEEREGQKNKKSEIPLGRQEKREGGIRTNFFNASLPLSLLPLFLDVVRRLGRECKVFFSFLLRDMYTLHLVFLEGGYFYEHH